MGFGDLSTDSGLACLDSYLLKRSYIDGYQASQADNTLFETLEKPPPSKYQNCLRWYNHIKSFGDDRKKLPGEKKTADSYGDAATSKSNQATGDDDLDLFGSDEEDDTEVAKMKAERLKAYEEKKKGKAVVVAKSSIILDVKPWDSETNMAEVERTVRSIKTDGLQWGASKLVPLAYGIKKLQI
ncbi:unnamed protein product, partial [Protopolystoma xenopodis]